MVIFIYSKAFITIEKKFFPHNLVVLLIFILKLVSLPFKRKVENIKNKRKGLIF